MTVNTRRTIAAPHAATAGSPGSKSATPTKSRTPPTTPR